MPPCSALASGAGMSTDRRLGRPRRADWASDWLTAKAARYPLCLRWGLLIRLQACGVVQVQMKGLDG